MSPIDQGIRAHHHVTPEDGPVAATVVIGYGFATAAMLVPALSEIAVVDSRSQAGGEEGI